MKIKELLFEKERIENDLNNYMFINEIEGKEKNEFWISILNLIDCEIELKELKE